MITRIPALAMPAIPVNNNIVHRRVLSSSLKNIMEDVIANSIA
jgi:hypothetical protein